MDFRLIKMNMFEGTNVRDGVTKIKQKLGVDDLKVKHIEIHEDGSKMKKRTNDQRGATAVPD